ncbi:ABC transporter [Acrocarpospora pleiomorpha]|uniref:Transport permease protein n=1 Tax=Acrocarpospora pleiomorpha TaxID=90975 RepID=A0A5M3XTU7_9ACTN|nr:ABC transporter permease [Acrocarpospora pleiomorpha]GES21798.1 ABC transporter [Acrocarpospora pleiomorpha]
MLRHTSLFLGYELRFLLRNPVWPVFGIVQPVMYLIFFAPLLGSTTPSGSMPEVLAMFTPGSMMMIALFGSLFAGFGLINETRNGVLERLAVSPAWPPAIILGRVAKDMITLVLQAILVMGVAMLMGLRIGLLAFLIMLALMATTGLFAASLSYGLALALRDENGMSQIVQFFAMPLTLIAGLFLPISLGPDWLQTAARFNPLYYGVEAGRALFRDDLSDSTIPTAFGLLAVLAVITLIWSMRSLRKMAG